MSFKKTINAIIIVTEILTSIRLTDNVMYNVMSYESAHYNSEIHRI